MDIREAAERRHSVRKYTDKPIPEDVANALRASIEKINEESGLKFALYLNEESGFAGKLRNVKNYIAFAGSGANLDERIGYYGARIMLEAQALGLNSCWVALSFNKSAVAKLTPLSEGEKIVNALALGYGETEGTPHRNKSIERLYKCDGEAPEWFMRGMEATLLAPTAINQQQFLISYKDGEVSAKAKLGPCNKIDLGIVEYYFELGSGKRIFDK